MDCQQSLKPLRQELTRRGLPSNYIERVILELDEHREDALAQRGPASSELVRARLGDVRELAQLIVAEYQARSFVGRHPFLTFVVAPIPTAFLAWIGLWVVFMAVLLSGDKLNIDWKGKAGRLFLASTCFVSHCTNLFVPSAATAVLLCHLSRRTSRSWPWPLTGCLLVAVLSATFSSEFTLGDGTPYSGHYDFGFIWFPYYIFCPPASIPWQIVQAGVPLAVVILFIFKKHRQQNWFVRVPTGEVQVAE